MSDPTPTQALLLFGLLARHGESLQGDLMPAVVKADREALERSKLIEVGRKGRGFYLKLADAGWAWTNAHLDAELPTPQRSLSDLLQRIGDQLEKSGETLADFIGRKPTTLVPLSSVSKPSKTSAKTKPAKIKAAKTSKAKAPPKPTAAAVRKRIEVAYLAITGNRKDESVRLSRLRAELSDLDRTTVDAGLARILKQDKKASLMSHDDPRQLDQTDRDAAFNPAGNPFHVIWIAS